jgi:hypothetical protein
VTRFLAPLGMTIMLANRAAAQKPPINAGRVVGQVAAGTLGVPVGFLAGYTIGSGFRPHGSSNTGVAVGFAGALLGPVGAVYAAGGPTSASFPATIGGAAAGYAIAFIAFPVARKIPFQKLKWTTSLATLLLPSIGATLAYNATRR